MKEQALSIKKMLEFQKEGMLDSREKWKLSMEQLDQVEPRMRQQLLERGAADLAADRQNALSTGMTGTTASRGQTRGSRATTQRALATLAGTVAQTKASAYQGRGAEQYQQWIDRANIRQRTKYDPFLQNFRFGSMGGAGASAGAGFGALAGGLFQMFTGTGVAAPGADLAIDTLA